MHGRTNVSESESGMASADGVTIPTVGATLPEVGLRTSPHHLCLIETKEYFTYASVKVLVRFGQFPVAMSVLESPTTTCRSGWRRPDRGLLGG
jgi:hypothetical protein